MKNFFKVIIYLVLIILITNAFRIFNNPRVAVLCYHNLATEQEKLNFPEESDWTITIDNFEDHLSFLKKHNYKTLTMEEFYLWKTGSLKIPYKSVLITFDDGFLSNYHYAFPLLKKYNMNATVFVVGSFIENSASSEWTGDIKTYINKEIMLDVQKNYPNVEIYSHSYNLHYQGAINQSKELILNDIEQFNNFYKNTQVYCYPFGQYNDTMKEALKESNYKLAFKYGPNKADYRKACKNDNNYEIPRLNVSHGMSKLKFGLRLLF